MTAYQVKIELEAPLLLGSGHGFGALVDTDIVFDDFGLPYFPARRLKGLLRESAVEVTEMLQQSKFGDFINVGIEQVFGSTSNRSLLQVNDLHLEGYEDSRDNIKTAMIMYPNLVNQQTLLDCLTEIRQQIEIEIEETTGTAKDHSLRTTRVLSKARMTSENKRMPLAFTGSIELLDTDTGSLRMLALAVKNLRKAGSQRNRGTGEIRCILYDNDGADLGEQILQQLAEHDDSASDTDSASLKNTKEPNNDMEASIEENEQLEANWSRMSLRINALSPLIFTGNGGDANIVRTLDYIPGASLRGYFAHRYMIKKGLKDDNAHLDKYFRRWFLANNLIFSNAYLIKKFNADIEAALYPSPYYLQRNKEGDKIYNLFNGIPDDDVKTTGGYSFIEDDKIYNAQVAKVINFHLSRGGNDSRLQGHSDDGNIFNYEAIKSGQEFQAYISGDKIVIEEFMAFCRTCFNDNDKSLIKARLGRSNSTQYGQAEILLDSPADNFMERYDIPVDSPYYLMEFCSPVILYNQYGFVEVSVKALQNYLVDISGGLLELISSDQEIPITQLAKMEEREAFVSHWKMRRPVERALAAGSSFIIKPSESADTKNVCAILQKLAQEGLGERRSEGYGQVRLQAWDKPGFRDDKGGTGQTLTTVAVETRQAAFNTSENNAVSPLTAYLFQQIIHNRISKILAARASENAAEIASYRNSKIPNTSQLGRLELMLRDSGSESLFREAVLKLKKPAREQLEACKCPAYNLFTRLTGTSYDYLDIKNIIDMKEAKEFAEKFHLTIESKRIDYFKIYWYTFFRSLRNINKIWISEGNNNIAQGKLDQGGH